MYPADYRYTREHEWVAIEDDVAVVGITAFAQVELGEIVFLELPEVGQRFDMGDEMGSIQSVKAVAEFYAPVSGQITAINQTAMDDPEVLNEDPMKEGWLVKIRYTDRSAWDELMDADEYESYLKHPH